MADTFSVSEITLLPYFQRKVPTLTTFDEVAQRNQGLLFRDIIYIDSSGVNVCLGDLYVSSCSGRRISSPCSRISPVVE